MNRTVFAVVCLLASPVDAFAEPAGATRGEPATSAPAEDSAKPRVQAPPPPAPSAPPTNAPAEDSAKRPVRAPLPPVPAGPAVPHGPNVVIVEFSLYRIRGDISGNLSLTEDLWQGVDGEKPEAGKGSYVFFTLADLLVAGVKLEADQDGWKWDGQDEPPSGSRIDCIARPQVLVVMPTSFTIHVGSEDPILYFHKRADGLFELRAVHQQAGLTVTSKVEPGEAGRLRLRDLSIVTRVVEKRKPIEGVALDVGEPVISSSVEKVSISVMPGKHYGVHFTTHGMGSLLLRLRLKTAPD